MKHNGNKSDFFDSTPSYNGEIKDFIDTWKQHSIWLRKIQATDRQVKMIRNALRRPYFKAHWRESFAIMAKSPFLIRARWFNFDWYLEPDNFDKILEGKYIDDRYRERLPLPTEQAGGRFGVERVEIDGVIEERIIQLPVNPASDETL